MQRKTSKTPTLPLTAALMAALGIANLSPVQLTATGVALGLTAVAMPALASAGIPGVGVIVKKKPGNAPIIAPGDNNGVVRLTGLEPGEYQVNLVGDARTTIVKVGDDGVLTTVAVAEDDGSKPHIEAVVAGGRQTDWCKPMNEICPYLKGSFDTAKVFDMRVLFAGDMADATSASFAHRKARRHAKAATAQALPASDAVASPMAGAGRGFMDANISSAAEIVRLAPTTSAEGAAFIVAERTKGGAFKDPIDFAQRVCPKVSIDFDLVPTRIGDTRIIARGGSPKSNGFKCAPPRAGEDPTLELYGTKHHYVGHVTLLR